MGHDDTLGVAVPLRRTRGENHPLLSFSWASAASHALLSSWVMRRDVSAACVAASLLPGAQAASPSHLSDAGTEPGPVSVTEQRHSAVRSGAVLPDRSCVLCFGEVHGISRRVLWKDREARAPSPQCPLRSCSFHMGGTVPLSPSRTPFKTKLEIICGLNAFNPG